MTVCIKRLTLTALLAGIGISQVYAQTHSEILATASDKDWQSIPQQNLLYMDIAGKDNKTHQVVIELAPTFAPKTVAQIREFAHQKLWDNTSIYRSHDNYVVQFGILDKDDKPTKDLPVGTNRRLPPEYVRSAKGLVFSALPDKEPYSDVVGFSGNFPVAIKDGQAFIPHCYGMVGVSRGMPNDEYTASDLYVITGQPARHLDRQIAVAGRVISGIEQLSAIPRGPSDDMGFYADISENTPILSVRLGSDLPKSEQIHFEALDTKSRVFKKLIDRKRNRKLSKDDWFVAQFVPYLDVCYIRPEVRKKP